jgi:hypothetical protein
MPVEMEHRLAAALAHVHDDPIVLEAGVARGLGYEIQHPLGLAGREIADLAEARDMPLGEDEEVGIGSRIDVANRDESVGLGDVIAFTYELAEETVLRQRRSPPPKRPRRERG